MPSSSRLPSAERATTSTTVTRSWTIETPSAVRPYEVVCSVRSPATLTSTTVEQTATAPPMNSASISGQPRARPVAVPIAIVRATWTGVPARIRVADAAELVEAELEADAEHQQRHADVGERQDILLRRHDPGREGTDGQTGGDVADHRRHAEPMGDGPEDESRCERDEQSQLEGHRRLGGMAQIIPADPDGLTLPPMLGGGTLSRPRDLRRATSRPRRSSAIVARATDDPAVQHRDAGRANSGVSCLRRIGSRRCDLEIAPDVLLAVLIPGADHARRPIPDRPSRPRCPNLPAVRPVLATVGSWVTACRSWRCALNVRYRAALRPGVLRRNDAGGDRSGGDHRRLLRDLRAPRR